MRALTYSFGVIIIVLCLIVTSCGSVSPTQARAAYDDGYSDGLKFGHESIQTVSDAQEWLELYPDFETFYKEHHRQRPFDRPYNEGFYDAVRKRCEIEA